MQGIHDGLPLQRRLNRTEYGVAASADDQLLRVGAPTAIIQRLFQVAGHRFLEGWPAGGRLVIDQIGREVACERPAVRGGAVPALGRRHGEEMKKCARRQPFRPRDDARAEGLPFGAAAAREAAASFGPRRSTNIWFSATDRLMQPGAKHSAHRPAPPAAAAHASILRGRSRLDMAPSSQPA